MRRNDSRVARAATAIVLAHVVPLVLHTVAHFALGIIPGLVSIAFIALVITLAPVLAAVLSWTRHRRIGAWLLLASMSGSLIFGLYNHFVAHSPDHVSQVPAGGWGALFGISAILMSATEVLGCWIGGWAVLRTRGPRTPPTARPRPNPNAV